MFKWLHHILEPHCPDCVAEREEKRVCQSCETLKTQLEVANYERRMLLNQVIELSKPQVEIAEQKPTIDYESLKPRAIPWNVRKQMLEAEDRIKAAVIREAVTKERETKVAAEVKRGPSGGLNFVIPDVPSKQSVEELEKELGIDAEANVKSS